MGVFPPRQGITYTHSLGSIGQKRLTISNQIAQVPQQEVEFVYNYIEDITRGREDINLIFERQNNILRTSAASK